ncbi:hypothetical protein CNR22_21465 [Sphingobacteriaceae bacterium]|nr:hypothetical protein CNR22_21465 [Sphingobacteriaceae bacterium]
MLKSITPKFLNKLDTLLLENYPVVWMSKIHYAIWHGFVLMFLSALLGAVIPFQFESKINYGLWYFLISLIGFVFICIWTYNYVIFNKDKTYGKQQAPDSYLSFILVFLSLSIFALSPYPFEFIYNQRVANTFDKSELLNDIHTLNENYGYLVNSKTKYQTYRLSNKDDENENQYFNLKKLNNSARDYFTPYLSNQDFHNAYKLTKPGHIYNSRISEQELHQRIKDYLEVSKKYGVLYKFSEEEYKKEYLSLRNLRRINTDTTLRYSESYGSNMRMILQNVSEAQYFHLFIFTADYFKTLLHIIFFFTTLLILFKMNNWRQYLIVALVYIFYPIVALIFSQLIHFGYTDSSTNATTFWTFLFVAVCTVSLFFGLRSNYFKPDVNILNQAFFVFAAYLPLIIVIILHEYTELFHNHEYRFNSYDIDIIKDGINNPEAPKIKVDYEGRFLYDYWRAEYEKWNSICIYFGLIAFIVFQPLFNRLFAKQLALPRKA